MDQPQITSLIICYILAHPLPLQMSDDYHEVAAIIANHR